MVASTPLHKACFKGNVKDGTGALKHLILERQRCIFVCTRRRTVVKNIVIDKEDYNYKALKKGN